MTIQEIIEEIKTKTAVELCDLVHALEEEFGVSAAAAVVAASVAGAAVVAGAVSFAPPEHPTKVAIVNAVIAAKNCFFIIFSPLYTRFSLAI